MSRYDRVSEILRDLEFVSGYAPMSALSDVKPSGSPSPVPVDGLWTMACQARDSRTLHRAAVLCREILVLDPGHLEVKVLSAEIEQAEKQAEKIYRDIGSGQGNRSLTELMNLAADADHTYPNHPLRPVVYPGLANRFRQYLEVLKSGRAAHQRQEIIEARAYYQQARKLDPCEPDLAWLVELMDMWIQKKYGG